jgi:type IX secretion system PorP/SprF family membrane protein
MIMKKLIIILAAGISGNLFSQQIPQYSQYLRNQFMVNPGAAGMYDFTDITLSGRWQWLGFGNNTEPMTAYASFSTLLRNRVKPAYNPAFRTSMVVPNPQVSTGKLKHAVGGQMLIDQYGAFRRINFGGTYSIHLPVSEKYNLSFGTRLGLSNNTFLSERAVVLNTIDPTQMYAGGDAEYDAYTQNQGSKFIMDIGAGLYFYSDKMFVGVSADHLSKDMVEFGSGTANFNTQLHYNILAGVKIPLNEEFTLTPAVLIKNMRPAPFSIEGTLMAEYKEWMWFGLSYRHKDAVVGMFGMNISEQWKIGYSYDYSISYMGKVSSGGHELVLGIMLR